ncbi:hypothetical protein A3734_13955 [Sulfitobacter sp. HI0054]|nr:hypothetical protein A3734_13955 [Sulfitobacter sp. HI0054]|tara:strand:+ start:575 stop:781 length:207 start_codon:yes stop_codon:yes gene_type:complete
MQVIALQERVVGPFDLIKPPQATRDNCETYGHEDKLKFPCIILIVTRGPAETAHGDTSVKFERGDFRD